MSHILSVGGFLAFAATSAYGIHKLIKKEPNSHTIAKAKNQSHKDKFGEDFKHHMVDDAHTSNSDWWNWVFKYRWMLDNDVNKESIDGEFKNVNSGAEIKEKCKSAYGKETQKEIRKDGKSNYEKSVWRYCSLEGQKPITLQETSEKLKKEEAGDDNSKIGKANESVLISTLDLRNRHFWLIQEMSFFTTEEVKPEPGMGQKSTEPDSKFKKLYDGPKDKRHETVVEKCFHAYKELNTAITSKKDALRYCSLSPKEEN